MDKVKAFGICLYKKREDSIKILLCKSAKSNKKWGFLKGVAFADEIEEQTAIREFFEESSIKVDFKSLEKLFIQKNESKNIGIYLVDYDNVEGIEKYFHIDRLDSEYLSSENSDVCFYNIKKLPFIKQKQKYIVVDIVKYLLNT